MSMFPGFETDSTIEITYSHNYYEEANSKQTFEPEQIDMNSKEVLIGTAGISLLIFWLYYLCI